MEIVSTVISDIVQGDMVIERSIDQMVTLSMQSASAGDAASISGTNLWAVTFYYTPFADGAVDPTIGSDSFDLTQQNLNLALVAGMDLNLMNLDKSSVDLSGLVCPPVSL